MYFHPRMFDWTNDDRTSVVWQAVVDAWFESVARQQRAHADAISMYCTRQVEGLRRVDEARNTAQVTKAQKKGANGGPRVARRRVAA